jgi:hypothetical protein
MRCILWVLIGFIVFCGGGAVDIIPGTGVADCTIPDGFAIGVIHGFLSIWTFVLSFFYDIGIYEFCNTGNGYLAGFILGVLIMLGAFSDGHSGSSRRRSDDD